MKSWKRKRQWRKKRKRYNANKLPPEVIAELTEAMLLAADIISAITRNLTAERRKNDGQIS